MIKTAGGTATNYIVRNGYGDFPLNTVDWTLLFRFKYTGAITGTTDVLALFSGNPDFTGSYVAFGSSNNTSDFNCEIFNGTTTVDTAIASVTTNAQKWAALTYNHTTHVATLIVDGSTIGTVTIDLSSITWKSIAILGNSSGASSGNVSIAYCRAWSSILTSAQLTAEVASITAVVTSGLIWDTPLQTSIDLTAHNNTLNQLTAVGTITTDTTDPLLSIVAGPPTNTSPATAIALTTTSAYFQDVNTAGVATSVWHKADCTVDGVWGAEAFGDLTTYEPKILVFDGLANANSATKYLGILGDLNLPIQFPVVSGHTYYFESVRNGAVAASTLQVSILQALSLPVPAGSIAVSDDTSGFPAAFLDLTTGYPLHFAAFDAFGEGIGALTNGKVMVGKDAANNKPNIFNTNLSVIAEVNLAAYDDLTSNQIDTFGASNATTFRLINQDGTLNPTVYNPTSGGVTVGLNNDNSLLYYAISRAAGQPIKTWNLTTNVAGSDLAAGIANFAPTKDIMVLLDGTILVPRVKLSATTNYTITRYNAAGIVLNTYDLGVNASADNRIATALDNTTSFWSWDKDFTTAGLSNFKNVKLSDGSIISSVSSYQFESGLAFFVASNTPARFGHSESCPFWILRNALFQSVNNRSGIYYLTGTSSLLPTQRHDTLWIDAQAGTSENKAIP